VVKRRAKQFNISDMKTNGGRSWIGINSLLPGPWDGRHPTPEGIAAKRRKRLKKYGFLRFLRLFAAIRAVFNPADSSVIREDSRIIRIRISVFGFPVPPGCVHFIRGPIAPSDFSGNILTVFLLRMLYNRFNETELCRNIVLDAERWYQTARWEGFVRRAC
jgi:hypothetical protein